MTTKASFTSQVSSDKRLLFNLSSFFFEAAFFFALGCKIFFTYSNARWGDLNIVIMEVSYGLVLSLLQSVIRSLSKMKQRQKPNSQNHLAARTVMVTINRNIRQSFIHNHCERAPLIYDINLVDLSYHLNPKAKKT